MLAKEIAHVSEDDENEVGEICGDENVKWRCELLVGVNWLVGIPLGI